MVLSIRQRRLILKAISLFSVIRGYNILVLVTAQYLVSIYIFAPEKPWLEVLLDANLFVIVLASALAIAGGYIINNFYDAEKDLINRPGKTLIDNYISQNTKLSVYFVLNFLSVILASYISFRSVLFFATYVFFIWFYSHKLKKYPFIGNLMASVLTIAPFFAVFVYYHNFKNIVFVHAIFLYFIVFMQILTKDLANLKGDFAQNYKTVPVIYGEKTAKFILTALALLTVIPVWLLLTHYNIGNMQYYFYGSLLLLAFFLLFLWVSSKKKQYITLHLLLKVIILMGILSIVLIEADHLVRKIL